MDVDPLARGPCRSFQTGKARPGVFAVQLQNLMPGGTARQESAIGRNSVAAVPAVDDAVLDNSEELLTFDATLLALLTPATVAEVTLPVVAEATEPVQAQGTSPTQKVPTPAETTTATVQTASAEDVEQAVSQSASQAAPQNAVREELTNRRDRAIQDQQSPKSLGRQSPAAFAVSEGNTFDGDVNEPQLLTDDRQQSLAEQPDRKLPTAQAEALTSVNELTAVVPAAVAVGAFDSLLSPQQPVTEPLDVAEQIASEAVRHAEVVKDVGRQTFTMRLDPPELGKLTIEMTKTIDGMVLKVHAAEAATLSLIESSIDDLNNRLSQSDSIFQEMEVDVRTGRDSDQPPREHRSGGTHRPTAVVSSTVSVVTTRQQNDEVSFVA
jgi:flagellar hook-length control protein FliK